MKLSVVTIFLLIAFGASAQRKRIIFPPPVLGIDKPNFIVFCNVPDHKNERVYTRSYYAGVDEYWSLKAPDSKECPTVKAELDLPDSLEIRPEFLQLLREVHINYTTSYLIIDAIGVYSDSNKAGYGHLGSNKANFKVERLVDVQLVKKKR
ncbi:hypothetical protein [Mucilaginibacter pedocola]|uniref:Uncharacterized protein n=1 Tax=Mucilaginibacter pedocola TaxID=1792845 RepID=A0A1S9PH44_9SPHI|nr:hypothetical protein [Mucilaginibacter pedocola]OOQ60270.1 hypothetical protein BC343_26305 [Mucilaginibacter pedocola]